jgi:hypothetical protein
MAAVPSRKAASVAMTIFFIAIPPELPFLGVITMRGQALVPVNLIFSFAFFSAIAAR